MTKVTLVSVIVPIYNAAKFLPAAIESVLAQTHPHWELLLVDDGSTDGSVEIARRYAQRHPDRIRCLAHEGGQNRGKSTTRNLGIQHAQGEYIAFLDADDLFLPDKLAHQLTLLAAWPEAGMVYGRTEYWFNWPGAPPAKQKNFLSRLGVQPGRLYSPPDLLTRYLIDSGTVPCICSLLARRSLLVEIGMFDERIQHLYEDQVLLAKLCLAALVLVEDGCGERYRQHPESSSNLARQTGEYDPWLPDPARLRFLTWLGDYLAEQAVDDPQLHRALRRALQAYRNPTWQRLALPLKYLKSYASATLERLVERT
jgi:glycosyltransferase involved in cell wall biosynthesis